MQAALELYDILSESNIDLRQPVGLEEQLLKDDVLDSEVGQSMLQLLQVRNDMCIIPCLLFFVESSSSPPFSFSGSDTCSNCFLADDTGLLISPWGALCNQAY